jgi:hypothetical protein
LELNTLPVVLQPGGVFTFKAKVPRIATTRVLPFVVGTGQLNVADVPDPLAVPCWTKATVPAGRKVFADDAPHSKPPVEVSRNTRLNVSVEDSPHLKPPCEVWLYTFGTVPQPARNPPVDF